MPWTTAEQAREHNKGLTDKEVPKWLKIANSEREKCIAKGGNGKECDAKAIRIANSVISGMKENEWMSAEYQRKLGETLKERIMDKLNEMLAQLKAVGTDESKVLLESIKVTDTSTEAEINADITKISEFLKSVPIEPEMLVETESVPINEGDVKEANIPIKIIQPGWGSSGYYSKKLLENAAGKYKAGTLMYWDHPTESEERDRPERSLRDVAGVLVSDGTFKEDGKAGPGIYALAKPFPEFRTNIEAMGPYIGISHRAMGLREQGEAEGRKGHVIKNIMEVASVDFVTVPGAGGRIVSLFESAKNGGAQENIKQQEEIMEKELKETQEKLTAKETELAEAQKAKEDAETKLKDAETKLKDAEAKLTEKAQAEMAEQVTAITKTTLDEVKDLPEAAKARIKVSAITKEDGTLDEEKVKEAINEQVAAERNYLAELKKTGTVKEMGDTTTADTKDTLKDSFKAKYIREGKSEADAERLAAIAAR